MFTLLIIAILELAQRRRRSPEALLFREPLGRVSTGSGDRTKLSQFAAPSAQSPSPENDQVFLPDYCLARPTPWVAAILAGVVGSTTAVTAGQPPVPTVNSLQTVIVTAKRAAVPDEVLTTQVVTALHDDPYFPDMHVEVTVTNGALNRVRL